MRDAWFTGLYLFHCISATQRHCLCYVVMQFLAVISLDFLSFEGCKKHKDIMVYVQRRAERFSSRFSQKRLLRRDYTSLRKNVFLK